MTTKELLCTNASYVYCTLDHFLAHQQELRQSRIDLYALAPHVWINHLECGDLSMLGRQIASFGLSVGVLTPEQHTARYSLCTADPQRWERSEAYFLRCIEAAAVLGAETVSLYPAGCLRDDDPEQSRAQTAKRLHRLAQCAGERGVRLAVGSYSPGTYSCIQTLSALSGVMREANHPNLYATLDTLSAGLAGESVGDWFAELGQRIAYVRLCDGRAGPACPARTIWGQGVFPLEHTVGELNRQGYSGPVGLAFDTPTYPNDPAEYDQKNCKAVRAVLGGGDR